MDTSSKKVTFRQRLIRMTQETLQGGKGGGVIGGKVEFEQDPNWWRGVEWKFGSKCRGWTLWQIYKNNPDYLLWIKEFFKFKFNQGYLLSAIDAAIEFKNMRELEENY